MRFMGFTVDLILRHNKVSNWKKTFANWTFDATSVNDVIFHFKFLHLVDFRPTHSTIICFQLDECRVFFFCFIVLRWCRVSVLIRRKDASSCPERGQVCLRIFTSITCCMYFAFCRVFPRHFHIAIRHWRCRVRCFLKMKTVYHRTGHQQFYCLISFLGQG